MVGREGGKLGPSRVGVISQRPAEPGPDTGHVNTTPLTHHNLIDNLRAPILFADVYSGKLNRQSHCGDRGERGC